MKPDAPLKIVYTFQARTELKDIYTYNVEHRGQAQANRYEDFLIRGMDRLATEYANGTEVEDFPELRSVTLKTRSKRDGHIVIYEVDGEAQTVNILHIFHSKMNVAGRLSDFVGE